MSHMIVPELMDSAVFRKEAARGGFYDFKVKGE